MTLLSLCVRLHLTLVTALAAAAAATRPSPGSGRPPARRRDERGDVPGWVMVTVMSVGLVGAITAIARPELSQLVKNALDQVK